MRRVAFEDFLTRSVERAIRRVVRGNRGSGGSGRVEIQRTSQVVLPRTSMVVALTMSKPAWPWDSPHAAGA